MAKAFKITPLDKERVEDVSRFAQREILKIGFLSKEAIEANHQYFSVEYVNKLLEDKDVKFFIANIEDIVVGLAYGFKFSKDTFYICWVITSSRMRRSDIGSDMLNVLVESSPFPNIIADVRSSNRPSRKFFESNGFIRGEIVEHWDQKYYRYTKTK